MDVQLEPDATPLVRIIATTLLDATSDAGVARRAERLRGVFALRSEKDPQAVTMRFDRGRVELTRGVATDAQVVATVDLDNMSGPDAPKPKVRGHSSTPALRSVCRSSWSRGPSRGRNTHTAFWVYAGERRGMPELHSGWRASTTVSGHRGAGAGTRHPGSVYEIHGSATALMSIFSGNSVFGQDLLDGKVFAIGSMQHASVVTGAFLAWMMRGAQ